MRVLVVTTWFPSPACPAQAPFNLQHVKAIARNNEVAVVHIRLQSSLPSSVETYEGVRVSRVSLNLQRPWSVFNVIARIRRASAGADVLHTMAFSSALFGPVARWGRRLPWVHSEHWNGVVNPASVSPLWQRMAWMRRVLRKPDWLTGVTTQLADTMAQFGSPSTTSVIPCVVENTLEVVEHPQGKRVRLVGVGALIERKRPLMAVATLKWLTDRGHDVELVWVGDGPQRGAVEDALARDGIRDRFTITGLVSPAEVFGHFQQAHLFFLPTEQENFFTSAAEALSAGVPVVAPLVGGFDDYADATNSVLVASSDASPESFGGAILTALERFANVSPMDIADPIRARFSAKRIAAQFDEVYARIAKQ